MSRSPLSILCMLGWALCLSGCCDGPSACCLREQILGGPDYDCSRAPCAPVPEQEPEKKQPPVCEPKGVPEEPDSFQSALESPPDETLIPENILPPQCAPDVQPPPSESPAGPVARLGTLFDSSIKNVKEDYSNFYSCTSLLEFASGLGPAATMANTTIDDKFRFWYQTRVRSSASDQIARVAKNFGEGLYVVPACAAMDVVGNCLADCPLLGPVGDFGDRTVRAYLVARRPCC